MPLTKVSKSLITSVDPSQIDTTDAAAGQVLTYNASTNTWVASAAPGGILASSVAANGYTRLSNGLIIQWGKGQADAGGILTVTWPIPFPNQCFIVQATTDGNSSGAVQLVKYMSKSTTTGTYSLTYLYGGTAFAAALSADWLAIGY